MRFRIILILIFTILLLPAAFTPFERIAKCINFPYQLDNVEGFLLQQAILLHTGQAIYKPITTPPFLVGNYGPVYPLLNALFVNPEFPNFFSGRFLSAAALCGILIMSFFFIKRNTGSFLPGLLLCALYLSTYEVYRWIAYYRVDFAALFFSFSGLFFIQKYMYANNEFQETEISQNKNKSFLYFSIICFSLGIYTKQTFIAAPLSAFIYMFLNNRKTAFRYLEILLFVNILLFVILNIITKGQYALHTIYYNANKFDFWQLKQMVINLFWFFNKYMILLLIVYIAVNWRTTNLYTIYMYVCILTIIGIGKVGSAENYLLEPLLGIYIFICITLYKMLDLTNAFLFHYKGHREPQRTSKGGSLCTSVNLCGQNESLEHRENTESTDAYSLTFCETAKVNRYFIAALAFLSILFISLHIYTNYKLRREFRWANNPTQNDYVKADKILNSIDTHPGDILSEDAIFPLLAGRRVIFDPFILSELAKEGKWDESLINTMIKRKQISLIITTDNLFAANKFFFRYTKNFIDAVKQNYHLLSIIGENTPGTTYYIFEKN